MWDVDFITVIANPSRYLLSTCFEFDASNVCCRQVVDVVRIDPRLRVVIEVYIVDGLLWVDSHYSDGLEVRVRLALDTKLVFPIMTFKDRQDILMEKAQLDRFVLRIRPVADRWRHQVVFGGYGVDMRRDDSIELFIATCHGQFRRPPPKDKRRTWKVSPHPSAKTVNSKLQVPLVAASLLLARVLCAHGVHKGCTTCTTLELLLFADPFCSFQARTTPVTSRPSFCLFPLPDNQKDYLGLGGP